MKPQLTFRTQDQLVLWKEELLGQISDGHWENSRPHEHWKDWHQSIELTVGEDVGRNFSVRKDNYNLASSDLLSVVAGRMLVAVRLSRVFGPEHVNTLSYCFDMEKFKGPPGYSGAYWDAIRQRISRFNLATVEEAGRDRSYDLARLRKDLRDMKKIIRTVKVAPTN